MININEIIIVEGKYDKIKLKQFINATIIETNGFRIFNDKNKQNMIRKMGIKNGVIVLTDSDSAGFVIRNFLKSILPSDKIKHAYIPEILGKEKRKETTSKEGLLGVEGIEDKIIKNALEKLQLTEQTVNNGSKITKADFFVDGFSGGENSSKKREILLKKLNLPKYITSNALIEYINTVFDICEYKKMVLEVNEIIDKM